MLERFETAKGAFELLQKSMAHRTKILQAQALLQLGFQINARDFHLCTSTRESAEQNHRQGQKKSKAPCELCKKNVLKVGVGIKPD